MRELILPPPSEKQKLFLIDKHKYIAFGGARGGGKSFAVDMKVILSGFKYPGIRQLIVRETYKELEMNHIRQLKEMLMVGTPNALAKYNDSKKCMTLLNGSTIEFDYCSCDKDINHFQGGQWDQIFIDEATNIAEDHLRKITACMRGVNNFPKHTFYTCNPGGKSMGYIKRVFIDRKFEIDEDPDDFTFIQSLLTDNKALMRSQPDYIKQLESLPPKLKAAWLMGRWDVFEGAYFEEFRDTPDPQKCFEAGISVEEAQEQHKWTHVIEPFDIPSDWKLFRSYDWGYGKPFAMTYYAMPPGDDTAYMIMEVYGCTKTPNEGIKWSNKQQFDYFRELEDTHPYLKGKRIEGVADPSIWDGSHGISAAEEADKHQIYMQPGINDRVPGWMQVHERFKFDENGYARLYIFNTCKHTIRTIPLQMFDEHKVEDLDSNLEDHLEDTIRYFAMMRPVSPLKSVGKYNPISDPLNQYTAERKAIIRRF